MILCMLRACLSILLALPLLHGADELAKPDKITLHTWVREDLFAGWIANDTTTFERGATKVDRYLADHPDDRNGLAWKYLVVSYRMIQARTKGDNDAYGKQLAAAKGLKTRILAGEARDALNIIVGSSLIRTADVAPDQDRASMYREGRDLLAKVPEIQGKAFDTLPPHMRGELWAQLAYAADRLGETAERDRVLQLMQSQLAGTQYESRARLWQKPENLAKEKGYACISCHEPGRLAPALARVNATTAK